MAKKKVRKPTSKVTKKSSKKPKSKGKLYGLLVIAALVVLIVWLNRGEEPAMTENDDAVVAYINNQPVYQSELEKEAATLPPQLQLSLDQNAVLAQLIDKKLLAEEARKANIDVTKDFEEVLTRNEITEEQLQQNLDEQGISMEEFKDQLRIFRFINQSIFTDIRVSDDEIDTFYVENSERFIKPETVTARHILVSTAERTDEEALEIMSEVEAALEEAPESFCELVTEYSEDPGSVQNCGEYPAFDRASNFVQEYKDAAFSNEVGEHSIAKTQFGYHLIQTTEKTSEEAVDLELVRENVRSNLIFEKQKEVFTVYIEALREEANVVNCFETPEKCSSEMAMEEKDEPETSMSMPETEQMMEETMESGDLDGFAQCLTDNGVKMFGAYWCSHCESQKKLFGSSFDHIEYIECSEEGNPRSQTAACAAEGIEGYPTWEIDGQKYFGGQTLENLAGLTGCEL